MIMMRVIKIMMIMMMIMIMIVRMNDDDHFKDNNNDEDDDVMRMMMIMMMLRMKTMIMMTRIMIVVTMIKIMVVQITVMMEMMMTMTTIMIKPMIIIITIIICSNVCNSGHGVPSYCQGYNLSGQGQDLDNMQLYHRVMSNTYKAEREMKERETKWRAGVPGIPFAHKTSIQGNPMRSGDWKSSSKYHKYCTKED